MHLVNTLGLALVLSALLSEAHLKLFFNPWQMPIRNAPSSVSDGVFSAQNNQPCGGTTNWGRDNQRRYANVVDGQKVCARVNWNGGHSTTPNENQLRAVFRCQRPSQAQDLLGLDPIQLAVDGTDPPPEDNGKYVDARSTNARYDGYVVCAYLPYQAITTDISENDGRRQCTLSIMEGNSWGGCLDLLVYPNAANGGTLPELTPAPVPSASEYLQAINSPLNLSAAEGTYRIENCFTDTGGRCCLTGYFGVRNNGAVSARFYGNGGYGLCFELSYGYRDYQMILKPSKFSNSLYEANFFLYMGYDTFGRAVTTQNMSLTLRDGGSMYITNVGLDIPEVSDHDVTYFASLENGLQLGYIPWPNYTNSADDTPWTYIIIGIVGGVVLIYLVGGVIYNKCTTGYCEHPHIHAVLVGLGCVRKRRKKIVYDDDEKPAIQSAPISKPKSGFSLQLPPNWSSAIDPMSGEVYYFNTATKEVKWDRPT